MSDKIQLLNNLIWIIAILVALFVWKAEIVIDLRSENTIKLQEQLHHLKIENQKLQKYLGLDK